MLLNNYEVRVLVKGRPINEFPHNGQVFVEGRDGSNFEIEFKNQTPNRVEAVLSVDGRSVIDGEDAGPSSAGYLVEPYSTVRIPGWKLDAEQVAAFQFTGKKNSYSAQMSGGSTRNTGVLGAMVFSEKPKPPVYHGYNQVTMGGMMRSAFPKSGGYVPVTGAADVFGMSPSFGWGATGGGTTMSMSAGSAMPMNAVSLNNVQASLTSSDAVIGASLASVESLQPVEQTLGTAFGEATDFATTEVQFERGDLKALMVLYYDDARGLRARGIEVSRKKQSRVPAQAPQAFPGLSKGCTPPKGWNG